MKALFCIHAMRPLEMRAAGQADFVSRCLAAGFTRKELTMAFEGDEQLVNLWSTYLRHSNASTMLLMIDGQTNEELHAAGLDGHHLQQDGAARNELTSAVFEAIKHKISNQNVAPNLWNTFLFLLENLKTAKYDGIQTDIESSTSWRMVFEIEYDYRAEFVKNLFSLLFQEMSRLKVEASTIGNKAISLSVRMEKEQSA
jgi:hypothetical protein